jgi:hypothetical protein
MAENKTQPTRDSVEYFLAGLTDPQQLADCRVLVEVMQAATKEPPVLWGPSIVGFGTVHYVYESGREGDTPVVGFSPRKGKLSLYLSCDLEAEHDLSTLGKHTCGKGCLYIKRLSDVHLPTLKKLIRTAVTINRKRFGKPAGGE